MSYIRAAALSCNETEIRSLSLQQNATIVSNIRHIYEKLQT